MQIIRKKDVYTTNVRFSLSKLNPNIIFNNGMCVSRLKISDSIFQMMSIILLTF